MLGNLFAPLHVLFGLLLGLELSTSYSVHFFTQSVFFRNTCPYRHNLFCCSTKIISSIPSLSLNSLLGTRNWLAPVHLEKGQWYWWRDVGH